MSKYSQIKNIIFDLGNVVVDIDLNITMQRFKAMKWKGEENFLNKYHQAHFFGEYEQGSITSSEFITEIQAITEVNNSIKEVEDAWNALILDYKKERIECILQLKDKYKVFLLSNTNELHIDACKDKVPEVGSLDKLFDKLYYSYEMGLRKPNDNIYKALLLDAQIKAEETLFLDDSEANTEAAKALGIESWLVDDSDAWVARIKQELL